MNKMKAMMMATAMMAVSLSMTAQNQKSVNLTIGVLYPQTADLTISYEAGTKHHHAWEVFMNAAAKWKDCPSCGHICAESFWKQSTTWGIGMAYKPCVTRTRNAYGSLRLGGSLGSDRHEVVGGIHAGYEHDYALRRGWRLYWQVKTDLMINGEDLFRTGITVGVKIPTSPTR